MGSTMTKSGNKSQIIPEVSTSLYLLNSEHVIAVAIATFRLSAV